MLSVFPTFDPALGDAITQLESDATAQLTALDAHINTFKATHSWIDIPEFVVELNGASGGQIYSAAEKGGERMISAFNKNRGNAFANPFDSISAARNQAALSAAVTFISRLKEKTDFHREHASMQTIFEMVRQYDVAIAGNGLHTVPALLPANYQVFKTAELLREFHAYTLIQHYLEFYATPGLFDMAQMGTDLAMGIVQAPGTAGWSAVGPVVEAADELALQIYAVIHAQDFRDLNSMATNVLHNMIEDVAYRTNCPTDLEALYLAQSPPSVPVYNYAQPGPLVIAPMPDEEVVVGQTLSIPVAVTGLQPGDRAAVTFSGAVSGAGPVIVFTPTSGDLGINTIHIAATSSRNGNASFSFNITVLATAPPANLPPNAPSNLSPVSHADGVPLTPLLVASDFRDPDVGDTHLASRWIIRRNSENVRVYDSNTDPGQRVQLQVPGGVLAHNTSYDWQVEYQDQNGAWSGYSYSTRFKTAAMPSLTAAPLFDGNFGLRVSGLTAEGNLYVYMSTNLLSWSRVFTNGPVLGSMEWYDRVHTNSPGGLYAPLQMIGTGSPPDSPGQPRN
jgi:hypothetical protein